MGGLPCGPALESESRSSRVLRCGEEGLGSSLLGLEK